ncbi:MAG: choice-of-anchor D domain-containing protein, partial [Terriglobia bacterium]
ATTSAPRLVNFSNTGNAPMTITSITASGNFAQTNNCPGSLAGASYCTISVTFTPPATVAGGQSGTLTMVDNASGSPHTVALNGTGLGPVVSLSATILNFENQPLGTTSPPQTVTLGNTGNAPLAISNISVSGDYAQTNTCASPLEAGANCTISVTFTPPATVAGGQSGTLSITDDASGSPHTVALNGIGLGPLVTLSPSSLSFAGQLVGTTSPAQVITLSNAGNAPLTISTITASGDYAQTPACGGSIAAGANCTVAVTFKPTAVGIRDGAITITDAAAGSPRTISLSGTGQDLSISSSVTVRTISAGSAAAYVLFVTPLGGLHTNVSLTCTGVPSAAACRISPASLTLDGAQPVPTTVTITTTARSSSPPMTSPPRNLLGAGPWTRHALPMQLVGVLALAILASLALGRRRQIWLGLGLTLLLASLWVACGGGGEHVTQGTPPGTYTLTITTSSAGLTHNIKLTLIVN